MGFYFQPSSRISGGKLVFSLNATSSTGAAAGKFGELSIVQDEQIRALKESGAYWLEPDGSEVQLQIRTAESPTTRCKRPH
jgi:hypothetical protein